MAKGDSRAPTPEGMQGCWESRNARFFWQPDECNKTRTGSSPNCKESGLLQLAWSRHRCDPSEARRTSMLSCFSCVTCQSCLLNVARSDSLGWSSWNQTGSGAFCRQFGTPMWPHEVHEKQAMMSLPSCALRMYRAERLVKQRGNAWKQARLL